MPVRRGIINGECVFAVSSLCDVLDARPWRHINIDVDNVDKLLSLEPLIASVFRAIMKRQSTCRLQTLDLRGMSYQICTSTIYWIAIEKLMNINC